MIVICAGLLQLLLLSTLCLGQISQDSPVLHVVPPVRAPQVLCYLDKDAWIRTGGGAFTPEDIDTDLCTHIIYAFSIVEETRFHEYNFDRLQFASLINLRDKNPNLKFLISIGGMAQGAQPFQEITGNASTINTFVQYSVETLREYNSDGLDVAWQYPQREDRGKLETLLKKLRQAFEEEARTSGQPRLLLTATVNGQMDCSPTGYNVPEISKHVDFINVIMYNFHGDWDPVLGHNAPLTPRKKATAYEKQLTVDYSARQWMKQGAPKEKFMIGMPLFGRSFRLDTETQFDIGAPAAGGASARKHVNQLGTMAVSELCEFLRGATYVWDKEQQVPYAYNNEQEWVGFDDERSAKVKMDWLKKEGFGGISVWSLDLDDFNGICGNGTYPLLRAITRELQGYKVKLQYRGPFDTSYHINKNKEALDLLSALSSNSDLESKPQQPCSNDEFQCSNGMCIDRNERCDGRAHCSDGSDETYTLCKKFSCTGKYFRCKYGGCIQSDKRCNRVKDCVDASDEDARHCTKNITSPDGCVAPPSFPGTQYISGFCDPADTNNICIIKTGSVLAFGSRVHVRCTEGYSLRPGSSTTMTCGTNEKYIPFPPITCQRTCPPLVNYPNVKTECRLAEDVGEILPYYKDIPCDLPLVVGTNVTFTCPLHFKPQKKVVTCLANGKWDFEPKIECEPLCGLKRESKWNQTTVGNRTDGGSTANQTDYPWHAGIYWYDGIEEYKYVCAGSLISLSTILTAARCGFVDGRRVSAEQMVVALGKQKSRWELEDGNSTQRFSVIDFIVLPQYNGLDQSFSFDVGLVRLADPVTFDDHVYPVCVNELSSRFRDDHAVGLVPSWGGIETPATDKDLQDATIPYVPRDTCYGLLKKSNYAHILTHDKFCGGNVGPAGSKVSKGDRGGGLVYEDKGLYYVVGIVTSTVLRENFQFGAYTNVSTHSDWIRRNME